MASLTVLNLIKMALRDINVIAVDDEIIDSEANEALVRLNMLIDQWNNERLMCYQITTQQAQIFSGQGKYDIGLNDVVVKGNGGQFTNTWEILMQGNFGTLLDGDELGININGFTATHAVGISETKTQAMTAFAASIVTNLSAHGVISSTYFPLTDSLIIAPLSGNTVSTWSPSISNSINGTMLLSLYTQSTLSFNVNGTVISQSFVNSKYNTMSLLAAKIATTVPDLVAACIYDQNFDTFTFNSTKSAPLVVSAQLFLPNQGIGDNLILSVVPFDQNHIDLQRPNKIDSIILRDGSGGNTVDYTCMQVTNKQYQELPMKNINTTYPYAFLYVASYPNGTLQFFPVPSSNLTLLISAWSQLNQFSTLTDVINLPPAFTQALHYNLAIELSSYHNPPDSVYARVLKRAIETKSILKDINGKEPIYGKIDFALSGRPGTYPNILTG